MDPEQGKLTADWLPIVSVCLVFAGPIITMVVQRMFDAKAARRKARLSLWSDFAVQDVELLRKFADDAVMVSRELLGIYQVASTPEPERKLTLEDVEELSRRISSIMDLGVRALAVCRSLRDSGVHSACERLLGKLEELGKYREIIPDHTEQVEQAQLFDDDNVWETLLAQVQDLAGALREEIMDWLIFQIDRLDRKARRQRKRKP